MELPTHRMRIPSLLWGGFFFEFLVLLSKREIVCRHPPHEDNLLQRVGDIAPTTKTTLTTSNSTRATPISSWQVSQMCLPGRNPITPDILSVSPSHAVVFDAYLDLNGGRCFSSCRLWGIVLGCAAARDVRCTFAFVCWRRYRGESFHTSLPGNRLSTKNPGVRLL